MSRLYRIDTFKVDSNLMYLIQKTTGHSTEQILSYFQRMANGVIETYLTKKTLVRWIKKELQWHYEGFDHIPYKIHMSAYGGNKDRPEGFKFYVDVTFPKSVDIVDITEVMNTLIETTIGLDGAKSMEPFPAPRTKVPAGFKKFLHD